MFNDASRRIPLRPFEVNRRAESDRRGVPFKFVPLSDHLKGGSPVERAMRFDRQVFRRDKKLRAFYRPLIAGEFDPKDLRGGDELDLSDFNAVRVTQIKSGVRLRVPKKILGIKDWSRPTVVFEPPAAPEHVSRGTV